MNNIIFCAYAYKECLKTGKNIKRLDRQREIYLKNSSVALISAKKYNPDDTVMLITNLDRSSISIDMLKLLESSGVVIKTVPFEDFQMSNGDAWGLAFYKLNALSYVAKCGFDNICCIDTDVVIQGSFANIWRECEYKILMLDIIHGLGTPDYVELCKEYGELEFTSTSYPTHFGGEFYASNSANLLYFIRKCEEVYSKIKELKIQTNFGDEFISCIVANEFGLPVKNAAPYVERFWTSGGFRLVSDHYINNSVVALHLPNEKENGILKIYDMIFYGKYPSLRYIYRICRLSHIPFIDKIKIFIRNFPKLYGDDN